MWFSHLMAEAICSGLASAEVEKIYSYFKTIFTFPDTLKNKINKQIKTLPIMPTTKKQGQKTKSYMELLSKTEVHWK